MMICWYVGKKNFKIFFREVVRSKRPVVSTIGLYFAACNTGTLSPGFARGFYFVDLLLINCVGLFSFEIKIYVRSIC